MPLPLLCMDHYPHSQLDSIEANPKRRDVIQLVAEVKRLTAIALAAEQLLNDKSTSMRVSFENDLRYRLGTKKSEWPLYSPTFDKSV